MEGLAPGGGSGTSDRRNRTGKRLRRSSGFSLDLPILIRQCSRKTLLTQVSAATHSLKKKSLGADPYSFVVLSATGMFLVRNDLRPLLGEKMRVLRRDVGRVQEEAQNEGFEPRYRKMLKTITRTEGTLWRATSVKASILSYADPRSVVLLSEPPVPHPV